ncbi:MAG: hydroxyethylthiazole kinase [Schwartzia sp.]|nr:hydroxyethylthiazole kinase [Schwartzia sp. (in: firmicutes)]MBR1884824.1 hydroxyethylthiazole kinase [Schwartzia sp. (in: firmicutes)]
MKKTAKTTKEGLRREIREAVRLVREKNPMAPSITNTVTINLVANAQLAVGGSAAMVYLADEGEAMAALGGAMYINMGTLMPFYAETLPRTVKALAEQQKPWVVDPVGIGVGGLRTSLLLGFRTDKPTIIRGNASEIIALAELWELDSGKKSGGVRGVDATDPVEAARTAAVSLARHTGGAVAVSGPIDLVTDGKSIAFAEGGSKFLPMITGAGCSLGGVAAVYACVAAPFVAALTATAIYNFAGETAEKIAKGPASFQTAFLDALYRATPEEVGAQPFTLETAGK